MVLAVDRRQQLENRVGAALYRVACLKQQVGDVKSPRLAPKLLQEIERLAVELEQVVRELAESLDAVDAARRIAGSADARARLLFQVCPSACLSVADDGTILEANPAAAAMLNVSGRHLAGKPLHLFVNGDRTEFMSRFARLREDEPSRWSGRLQPRERSMVPVDAIGIVDGGGHRLLLFESLLDPRPRRKPGLPQEQEEEAVAGHRG
jgi:PAS domain-containing protein